MDRFHNIVARAMSNDISAASVKLTPTVGAAGVTVAGIGLPDWVLIVSIVYGLLQIAFLISDRVRRRRKKD